MIEGHGDDSYKYQRPITANFSSNVYSKVDLSALKAHLCTRIDAIGNYPEPEPYTLESRLAAGYHLPADAVCVTNGAIEAIYLIAQTFRGTNTAILQPTFSEYADACRMHGHRITSLYQLPAPEEDGYLLPEDIRMLWLCNPNNPTGTVVDKEYLRELIKHNSQVCFIIDQSYEYFTLQPLFTPKEAAEYPNVLLLHSMTKRYAVPGLRLGYITGGAGLLSRLRTHRMPWSVNQLAIEAGLHLLRQDVPNPLDVPAYLKETARLHDALERLGSLEVWTTETHFMLVRLRFGRAAALKEYLANEHGILIRDASNFEGLDEQFFRIATQTPEENDRLVQAIRQWLES
ncbi:threonine-phosphate decarboxylase [uncultured Bacteroides sp.]|uniref:threonine-phosphate decarboxylase n=1 Tax=uncultured Bacteroides sp. TaxID=162156 RepID=UPI002586103C|nr:threonine-phosphate decarboxylase [uncultured Bacteroides sp.]